MSVHKKVKANGDINWLVRYRASGQNRQQTFANKKQAEAFNGQVRMRQLTGEMAKIDAGRKVLAEFGEEWWDTVSDRLSIATRQNYSTCWNNHVLPFLGEMQLRELTPRVIEEWRSDLSRADRKDQTVKKAMNVLQTCLQKAVVWGELQVNPVREVKKPSGKRTKAVRPVAPREIEIMRDHMLKEGKDRDAALLVVLGYAGLRPGEALALRWDHVRSKTLLIEQALAHGEIKETKTGAIRSVRILPALKVDLDRWRMISTPHPSGLVFASTTNEAGPWLHEAYKSWSRKSFKVAAAAAGRPDLRPYDLRHSFASLLIREGKSVVDVAAQLGHAPTMTLSTYAHVMADLDDDDRRNADELIQEAREEVAARATSEQTKKGSEIEEGAQSNVRHLFAGDVRQKRLIA
jgi:integrase